MDQIERIMNHSGGLSCVAIFKKLYPRIDFREQEGDSPFYTWTWQKSSECVNEAATDSRTGN